MKVTDARITFPSARRVFCWLTAVAIALGGVAVATPVYNTNVEAGYWSGSRSISIGFGLAATGAWGRDFTLSWEITNAGPNTLLYKYTLSWSGGAPSHAIFELSDGCASADAGCVWGFSVDGAEVGPTYGEFSGGPPNPNMPGSIYGVKIDRPGTDRLDTVSGNVFSFYSNRVPVWGNFYSKDGQAQAGGEWNAVWNIGLANLSSENVSDFIARPDSVMIPPEIPEPGTMLLLGAGLAALGLLRRKAQA